MSFLKNILSIGLAICIVILSSGFTVGRMQCSISGKVTVKLFKVNDCRGDDNKAGNSVESSCCNISMLSFALDAFSVSKFVPDFSLVPSDFIHLPQLFSSHAVSGFDSSFKKFDYPPPFYGNRLLHLISVLII